MKVASSTFVKKEQKAMFSVVSGSDKHFGFVSSFLCARSRAIVALLTEIYILYSYFISSILIK